MLQEPVDTTDVECLNLSSEFKNGSTPPCGIDIIDEIFVTSDACNASSSQSSRDEQNVTETIKCFNSQARILRNTDILEWWDKQAKCDVKRVANVALALPVLQASIERTFLGLS